MPAEKITWSDYPRDVRNRLLALYEDGVDLSATAEELGIGLDNLKRRLREWREETSALLDDVDNPKQVMARWIVFGDEAFVSEKVPREFPKLTELTEIQTDDQGRWIRTLRRLQSNGTATVMHLHDIHAPYHDPNALDVAYQLVAHIKPDVIVVGSDFADFDTLSSFPVKPDHDEDQPDALDTFQEYWYPHIKRLKKLSPKSTLVFIYGNHEMRLLSYLEKNAKKLRRTVHRDFVEIIKAGGSVIYLGDQKDDVRIGPLLVMHGNRFGENPAKRIFRDVGGQVCVQFGHNHRISQDIVEGEDKRVTIIGSGCLCKPAHYSHGRMRAKEQIGTAICFVDFENQEVQIDNLVFTRDNESCKVIYERKRFESEGLE